MEGELRDDGVAVIRLRRFSLFEGEEGYIDVQTQAEAQQYLQNMSDQLHAVFAEVEPEAEAIVWDVRGNIGGFSAVGFEIVAGMPGATPTPLARCGTRIAGLRPNQLHIHWPEPRPHAILNLCHG